MLITKQQLLAFAPKALSPDATAASLSEHAARCEINTPRRIRHFMAHLHHESQGFTRLVENLNYSAARLRQVWPSRFPTTASTNGYARNPRALANKVYGGRMGNVGPNDGWLYRGGAWIMLTGKANYSAASRWTGLNLVANPELARTVEVASQIACDFIRVNKIAEIWDADDDERVCRTMQEHITVNEGDDMLEGTKAINGGRIGLEDRMALLRRTTPIW